MTRAAGRRTAAGVALALGAAAARLAGWPGLAAGLVAGVAALALAPRLGPRGRAALGAGLGALLLAEWGRPGAVSGPLLAILPSLACALGAWGFARTLAPGREPLIVRYTRFDPTQDIAEVAAYARGLTGFWAAVLATAAVLHLLPLLPALRPDWPDAGTATPAVLFAVLILFLAEHAVRSLLFPRGGIAWPSRTFRAILAAERARHAG